MELIPFHDLGPYAEKVMSWQNDNGTESFLHDATALFNHSRQFIGGQAVSAFETRLAKHLDVQHVVSCANGTDALMLALRAAGIDRSHRVAIPNLTFWATYEAVVNIGATPVLIDIDPADKQMSFDEFKRAHDNRRFDAAILVHLYGWCSTRLDEFRALARERHITLIEDGAQAFGVRYDDQSVFAEATTATLSFYPGKVFGGVGDGGAVVCKTKRMANRVRLLANHGRIGQYEHIVVGWNSRLDAIQATWLNRALDVIDDVIDARRNLAGQLGAKTHARIRGNAYLLGVRHPDPATYQTWLRSARQIESRRIYPRTIADQEGAHGAIHFGELPVSREHAKRTVCLPLYYGMPDAFVERVADALAGDRP